ncbi:MAG: HNH endonuclease [Oscillospiraceae bacterium]|nr:HNH endonuclease [Oscillospiraceae bacterium]
MRGLYKPHYQYQYENTHVHHAIPVIESDNGHLDNGNLITLCSTHHRMTDRYQIPLLKIQNVIREQENK